MHQQPQGHDETKRNHSPGTNSPPDLKGPLMGSKTHLIYPMWPRGSCSSPDPRAEGLEGGSEYAGKYPAVPHSDH